MAENKIREAMQQGEFEDLPGQGEPLQLNDLANVPEELRASYIILKNGGVLPPEMELHKEIVNLRNLIGSCYDQYAELELKKKLSEKMLRYDVMMEKRRKSSSVTLQSYQHKVTKRFSNI